MSYGFRPGRGCKDALREVEGGLKKATPLWWMPIWSYFDTIPHAPLWSASRTREHGR